MSEGHQNPFAADAVPADPNNPYAAPDTMGDVARDVGKDGDLDLASRWNRFLGAFVDGLTMIPAAGGILAASFSLAVTGVLGNNPIVDGLVGGFLGMIISTLWYLILNAWLLSTRGQTIGKIAVGTKIVDAQTNELVPLGTLILKRWLVIQALSIIPVIGGFIPLGDALLIFRENRRCLHDDFAGTKVINV